MIHFHAGYNMPGYLPEMDVFTGETFESARSFLLDELVRHQDDWYVQNDGQPNRDKETGKFIPDPYKPLIADLESTSAETDRGWNNWTENLAYWIDECVRLDCEMED